MISDIAIKGLDQLADALKARGYPYLAVTFPAQEPMLHGIKPDLSFWYDRRECVVLVFHSSSLEVVQQRAKRYTDAYAMSGEVPRGMLLAVVISDEAIMEYQPA